MPVVIQTLPAIMQLITLAVPGFTNLITYVREVRATLKQSAEWTPEMESAFLDALLATKTDLAYQPDVKA